MNSSTKSPTSIFSRVALREIPRQTSPSNSAKQTSNFKMLTRDHFRGKPFAERSCTRTHFGFLVHRDSTTPARCPRLACTGCQSSVFSPAVRRFRPRTPRQPMKRFSPKFQRPATYRKYSLVSGGLQICFPPLLSSEPVSRLCSRGSAFPQTFASRTDGDSTSLSQLFSSTTAALQPAPGNKAQDPLHRRKDAWRERRRDDGIADLAIVIAGFAAAPVVVFVRGEISTSALLK